MMKKIFETYDALQANFVVSIFQNEKIPHTVTGLASSEFQGTVGLVEIFVAEDYVETALAIVEGME